MIRQDPRRWVDHCPAVAVTVAFRTGDATMKSPLSTGRSRTTVVAAAVSALVLMMAAGPGEAVAGAAGISAAPLVTQTGGMQRRGGRGGDRQSDRDDRQDTRDVCRGEGGAMGKDKRDCKQEGRQENRGPDPEPAPAAVPPA
jgi:hypothetical protein